VRAEACGNSLKETPVLSMVPFLARVADMLGVEHYLKTGANAALLAVPPTSWIQR
jgi:hypothetical protein